MKEVIDALLAATEYVNPAIALAVEMQVAESRGDTAEVDALIRSGKVAHAILDGEQSFFVILITKHFWTGATKEFKQALVDHELSHCWYDSEHDRYSMIEHDVAEFTAIVKRHGAWKADLDQFFKAAKQVKMSFTAEAKAQPATGPRPVADLPPAS